MKKLLFILAMCITTSVFAQLNYFFPDSNAYFSVSWMKFHFQGDTIIDNYKYKKVYMQAHDSIADFNKAYYFAAIREDTVAEKVYCYTEDYYYGAREYLLYDFSVNMGDVVSVYSFWPSFCPTLRETVVTSIDSILIENQYRKRINFTYGVHTESWIEGIGSTNGIFFAIFINVIDVMDVTFLLCMHKEGELIYKNPHPFFDKYNCYFPSYGANIIEKTKEIKIYPTIANDFLYIETDNHIENLGYKIMNLQGQIMNGGILTSKSINISNLNKGINLIMIYDYINEQIMAAQKFIKY